MRESSVTSISMIVIPDFGDNVFPLYTYKITPTCPFYLDFFKLVISGLSARTDINVEGNGERLLCRCYTQRYVSTTCKRFLNP